MFIIMSTYWNAEEGTTCVRTVCVDDRSHVVIDRDDGTSRTPSPTILSLAGERAGMEARPYGGLEPPTNSDVVATHHQAAAKRIRGRRRSTVREFRDTGLGFADTRLKFLVLCTS